MEASNWEGGWFCNGGIGGEFCFVMGGGGGGFLKSLYIVDGGGLTPFFFEDPPISSTFVPERP